MLQHNTGQLWGSGGVQLRQCVQPYEAAPVAAAAGDDSVVCELRGTCPPPFQWPGQGPPYNPSMAGAPVWPGQWCGSTPRQPIQPEQEMPTQYTQLRVPHPAPAHSHPVAAQATRPRQPEPASPPATIAVSNSASTVSVPSTRRSSVTSPRTSPEDAGLSQPQPVAAAHEPLREPLLQPSPPTRMFVGQLPLSITEADVRALFEPFGAVADVRVLRDKQTQKGKGAAFVCYREHTAAERARRHFDGKVLLQGAKRRMYLRYTEERSDPSREAKLYVANLPLSAGEDALRPLFARFGDVAELVLLGSRQEGVRRGCAFVRYTSREAAEACIEQLDRRYITPGSTIEVRWADSDRERRQRRDGRRGSSRRQGDAHAAAGVSPPPPPAPAVQMPKQPPPSPHAPPAGGRGAAATTAPPASPAATAPPPSPAASPALFSTCLGARP
eukprot:TRINITY_DN10178_c1_g1_i1.p1 TRINITY_DN10178_c1_g1~~TRINITY_DN10178_c1_g1_i1.p1  ORF type:complete len:442 (+),score=138.02 TRINITY_DN10178_c1_g1_i1:595-1920(+)